MKLDPAVPWAVLREREPADKFSCVDVLSVFLIGAECSFRCTMCDLWKYTLKQPTQPGSLVVQLNNAILQRDSESWIKLYNASNFFDPRCVPFSDHFAIAEICRPFDRVIVENHPRMINRSIVEFEKQLHGRLEIALGLETIAPRSRAILNKEFSLDDFERACGELKGWNIELRAFVLLQPPGTCELEANDWVLKTLAFAKMCGVRHCSVIPTRAGNGAMEWLASQGLFSPPSFLQLENCFDDAIGAHQDMLVTADLWDLQQFKGHCEMCFEMRRSRLERMNRTQVWVPHDSYPCHCRDQT